MWIRAQFIIDNQAISMQIPKPEVQSQMYNQDETCVCVFKQQLISADCDMEYLNFPAKTCFLHAVLLVPLYAFLGISDAGQTLALLTSDGFYSIPCSNSSV